jgi:CO dehydrogenase/acetyl-CoA synthase beta subunit
MTRIQEIADKLIEHNECIIYLRTKLFCRIFEGVWHLNQQEEILYLEKIPILLSTYFTVYS